MGETKQLLKNIALRTQNLCVKWSIDASLTNSFGKNQTEANEIWQISLKFWLYKWIKIVANEALGWDKPTIS